MFEQKMLLSNCLELQPSIIGFGVYIWNVEQTEKIVGLLKTVAPDIVIVLGGARGKLRARRSGK